MSPIDLDDGRASGMPLLYECLRNVAGAEFMVLLMGDTYGPSAPGKQKSYTQLEYEHAVREGSKTTVLVFDFSTPTSTLSTGGKQTASERRLRSWRRVLQHRHKVCSLDPSDGIAAHVDRIVKCLHEQVSLRVQEFGAEIESEVDEDEQFDGVAEGLDDDFDDNEIDRLEIIDAEARGAAPAPDAPEVDEHYVATHPAAVAAREQIAEGRRAIELSEYGLAVAHLKRALELTPMNGEVCTLLARLYLLFARTDRLSQAIILAERAARIAARDGLSYLAAARFLLAARAAAFLDTADAHRYVDLALEQQPAFARAFLERARIFCKEDEATKAVGAVREAYRLRNWSLFSAIKSPALRPIISQLRALLKQETERAREMVVRIVAVEERLRALKGEPDEVALDGRGAPTGLLRLRSLCQSSLERQQKLVGSLVTAALGAQQDASACPGSSAHAIQLEVERASNELSETEALERDSQSAFSKARIFSLLDMVYLPTILLVTWCLTLMIPSWAAILLGAATAALLSFESIIPRLRQWLMLRAQLRDARRKTSEVKSRHDKKLAECELRVENLAELRSAAIRKAQEALSLFEGRALGVPGTFLPSSYVNLRRATTGKLIRISAKAEQEFVSRYGRDVVRDDPFDIEPSDAPRHSLFRVKNVTADAVIVSRAAAYQSHGKG